MNRPVTLGFARSAPVFDFGPAYHPPTALGQPRPAGRPALVATELGPDDDCFDGRESVIARNAATTTVRSARRSRASKLFMERLAFAVLFVANAMLLGAILGLLVAGT